MESLGIKCIENRNALTYIKIRVFGFIHDTELTSLIFSDLKQINVQKLITYVQMTTNLTQNTTVTLKVTVAYPTMPLSGNLRSSLYLYLFIIMRQVYEIAQRI